MHPPTGSAATTTMAARSRRRGNAQKSPVEPFGNPARCLVRFGPYCCRPTDMHLRQAREPLPPAQSPVAATWELPSAACALAAKYISMSHVRIPEYAHCAALDIW
jgi:hypothetical protein